MAIPSEQLLPSGQRLATHPSETSNAPKRPDYLAFFNPRTEAIQRNYFLDNGLVMLNHSGKPDKFTPARAFLHDTAGISDQELDAVFTSEGALKPFEGGPIDLEHISPSQLAEILTQLTKPIYDMVNRSLDTSLPNGFNRHGLEHIGQVLKRAATYLQEQGGDEETMKLLVLEVFGHDLGNLFSRVNHPTLSMKLFDHIVPELQTYQHHDRIHTGILLHEEPVLKELAEHVWQTGRYNNEGKFIVDVDETAEAMRATFQPEWLALIRADKFDFGRQRVTESLKSPRALAEDGHTLVNMVTGTTKAEKVGDTFILELTYDHHVSPKEAARFQVVSRETQHGGNGDLRRRVHMPDSIHEAHRRGQQTYSQAVENKFWQLYEGRLRIAMAATYAQDSEVKDFQVTFKDNDIGNISPEKSNLSSRQRIFEKGHAEDGFTQLPHAA